MEDLLKGKRLLIVDDEPDVLETLEELLDMCLIDTAPNYDTAIKFLRKNTYDLAILDIMGVRGYDLLTHCTEKGVPAVMLTAHALNPENLVRSIRAGAQAYVPKDKISEIAIYLTDVLKAKQEGIEKHGTWFARLSPFLDKKFGSGWKDKDKDFWREFDEDYVVSKDELRQML